MFDTHCHLSVEDFKYDILDVVHRAQDAGVENILCVGLDAVDSLKCAEIAHRFDLLFTAGIHPHEALNYKAKDIETIAALCSDVKCCAIGEIGLDYKPGYTPRQPQIILLNAMLELAVEKQKPVVLHNRMAGKDLLEAVDRFNLVRKGVFHCFSEDLTFAEQVIARGFYISFTGNVTHPKSRTLEIAAQIPLGSLLVETDAPYQTPQPHHGRRNEPAYLVHTLESLAHRCSLDIDELTRLTVKNSMHLFGADNFNK